MILNDGAPSPISKNVQCDHSIDSNCADCYIDGTEAILQIPAVWVFLYVPYGYNFLSNQKCRGMALREFYSSWVLCPTSWHWGNKDDSDFRQKCSLGADKKGSLVTFCLKMLLKATISIHR